MLCGLGQLLSSRPLGAALGTVRGECRSGACSSSLQLHNGVTLVPDRGQPPRQEQEQGRGRRGRLVGDGGQGGFSWQRDTRGQMEMVCSRGRILGIGEDESKGRHVGGKCTGQDPGASSEGKSLDFRRLDDKTTRLLATGGHSGFVLSVTGLDV